MSTSVATVQPSTEIIPSASNLATMYKMARVLFDSGFLPDSILTPAAAFAIMQKGLELGIPPMHAFSSISVIKGKPVASAELILGLIYRDHGDDAYNVEETTDTICRVTYKRRTWKERKAFQFTIEEAKAAKLLDGKNDNWRVRPATMLRARCASAVGRLAFPDSIGGMRIPDEMTESGDGTEGEAWTAPPQAAPRPTQVIEARSRDVLGLDGSLPDEDLIPVPQQLPPSPRDNPPPTPIAGPVADVPDRGQANNYHDALYDTLAAAAHRHDGVERPALDLSVTSAEEVERSIKDLIKTLVKLPAIAGDTGVAMTQAQVDTILALKGRYTDAGVILGSLPRMTEQGASWLIDVLDSLAPLADDGLPV